MKKFTYQIFDPFISKSIEVNLNECKTVNDLKQKISFELHVFNHNLFFEKEPYKKYLKEYRDYDVFKFKFGSRCKDIDFLLPNKKIIRINDCYKKNFQEIIQSFREKKIYYSEECVKNIHFIVNKQEVPHIRYPLLAVPERQQVEVQMSCLVAVLDYGYNRFIFSDKEYISDAEKFISIQYQGFFNISILNDLDRKLKPTDKFRCFSKYKAQVIYKIKFRHISALAESTQHLDFLSTVLDAMKQLAVVYSDDKKLVPENIAIFDSFKIKINDPRTLLKNVQKLDQYFYFDIDKKKKFYDISTKEYRYQEPTKIIDSQLDEFTNKKDRKYASHYSHDFKFKQDYDTIYSKSPERKNYNNYSTIPQKHYNSNLNDKSRSPERKNDNNYSTIPHKYYNSNLNDKSRSPERKKNESNYSSTPLSPDIDRTGNDKHTHHHHPYSNNHIKDKEFSGKPIHSNNNHHISQYKKENIRDKKDDYKKEAGNEYNQKDLYPQSKKQSYLNTTNESKTKIKTNDRKPIYADFNNNHDIGFKSKKVDKKDDINDINKSSFSKKPYESKSKSNANKIIYDDDESFESVKVHIPLNQQDFESSTSSLKSKPAYNLYHDYTQNDSKPSSTTHYTKNTYHSYGLNNSKPSNNIKYDGNGSYSSTKSHSKSQYKQNILADIGDDDDADFSNGKKQNSAINKSSNNYDANSGDIESDKIINDDDDDDEEESNNSSNGNDAFKQSIASNSNNNNGNYDSNNGDIESGKIIDVEEEEEINDGNDDAFKHSIASNSNNNGNYVSNNGDVESGKIIDVEEEEEEINGGNDDFKHSIASNNNNNNNDSNNSYDESDKIIDDDDEENNDGNEIFKQSIDSIDIEIDNEYNNDDDDDDNIENNGSHELKKSANNSKYSAGFDEQQQSKPDPSKQLIFIIEEEEEEHEFSYSNDKPSSNMVKYYYQTNRDGAVYEIELDQEATVLSMKKEIAEKNDISNLNNIKIILSGKELPDNNLLESHNIGDTNLFVYIRSEDDIHLMTTKALQFDNNQAQLSDDDDDE